MVSASAGNLRRFSGFAALYDEQRPSPPARLGPLLAAYAASPTPQVVDIGSGTGLSTRWAARWAASVIGVEPNADMRQRAERASTEEGGGATGAVSYRAGTAEATGLAAQSADIALAVQAMHWMEPAATLAELARVVRPGGVFAVIDADWPPVAGLVEAESAWQVVHRRLRVFDARVARGDSGAELRRPISADDSDLADEQTHDPHRNRLLPDGVKSWAKSEHLARMERSGLFVFVRELLLDDESPGDAARFVALLRSQGSYQQLRRAGLDDDDLGVTDFAYAVTRAFAAAGGEPSTLRYCWRIRLGVFAGPVGAR